MKRILVAVFFSALAGTAQAQPYLGVGASHVKADNEGQLTLALSSGYRFGKHFAVEIGTFQPDRISTTYSVTTQEFSKQDRRLNGARLSALLNVPVGDKTTAFIMASAYRVKAKFSTLTNQLEAVPGTVPPVYVPVSSTSSEVTSTETLPGLGIGIEYVFSKSVFARATFENINTKAGMFGAGNDLEKLRTASFNVLYQF
mgnify:CR=1 FL=1